MTENHKRNEECDMELTEALAQLAELQKKL